MDFREFIRNELRKASPVDMAGAQWLPPGLIAAVLAPHPDDFDAIGMTLQTLHSSGHPIHAAVLTSGATGVEDAFCSPPTVAQKAAIRETEQRASCRFFGLAEDRLIFLRLREDADGTPLNDAGNRQLVARYLLSIRPALVFLPHPNDSNAGHRAVWKMLQRITGEAGLPTVAFLNRDPKTIELRVDAYRAFGEDEAKWKAELLKLHRSQHERNLNTRGRGFDQRILDDNRRSAAELGLSVPFAEVFEIELP